MLLEIALAILCNQIWLASKIRIDYSKIPYPLSQIYFSTIHVFNPSKIPQILEATIRTDWEYLNLGIVENCISRILVSFPRQGSQKLNSGLWTYCGL